jgi:hypothetical protein
MSIPKAVSSGFVYGGDGRAGDGPGAWKLLNLKANRHAEQDDLPRADAVRTKRQTLGRDPLHVTSDNQ